MNQENKKQIIIAGVLGAVLLGVLGYQLFIAGGSTPSASGSGGAKEPRQSAAERRAAEAKGGGLAALEIDIEELTRSVEVQPINYAQAKIARNPMAPLVGIFSSDVEIVDTGADDNGTPTPVVTRRPRLITGIIWDNTRPVAIIDNMVVHEGYVFADGAVVHEIEPTRVLLKEGDRISPVEMKEFGP